MTKVLIKCLSTINIGKCHKNPRLYIVLLEIEIDDYMIENNTNQEYFLRQE